jgi:5-(aminomethyl)-3-furanmethanol phosphate kinase
MTRISVVKVGGSLLAVSDLASRLRDWISTESATHPDTHFVMVVGGGRLADAIREIDAQTGLSAETCHWACIELMDVTARLIGAMLPELAVVDQYSALLQRLIEPGTTILQPSEFLKHEEPSFPGTRLIYDWSVTSDSIAGRIAAVVGAAELVLLKSEEPPALRLGSGQSDWLKKLADLGFVDSFLPQLATELPNVRCIDLVPAGVS